ncbi:MAG: SUMF1/EgtB/PvdO family nonheme iron enzyme [Anaerolineales bacterium]
MKTKLAIFVLLVLMVVACTPNATVTQETVIPAVPATELPVAKSPTAELNVQLTTAAEGTETPLKAGDVYSYVDGTTLVAVPSGEFTMGGGGNDNPQHSVTLHDFWIYSTLVTNQQFELCVRLGKCVLPDPADNPEYADLNFANHPVTGVTYDQAVAYCSFIGGRLPTEAEWEKAAGGPKGGSYPWGDQQPSCELANFGDCTNGKSTVNEHTGGASYYGALDMLGNVFQWVADWYDASYYRNSPADNPPGPSNGTERVLRSSGFDSDLDQLSILNRRSEDPAMHGSDIGFRCVVDQPQQSAPLCEAPQMYGANAATSTCPVLGVKQEELCQKNFPYTNVSVTGATDAKIKSDNCTALDDPAKVSCQPPSSISASAQCQVDISGDPTCPTGYSLQGSVCVVDNGINGTCPSGLNFEFIQTMLWTACWSRYIPEGSGLSRGDILLCWSKCLHT